MNGQNPTSSNGSARFNENNLSLLHSVSVPAENPKQSSYEMRLLSHWIAEIRETGRIKYPKLVEHLDQVFEVECEPEGAVLMPQNCDVLLENLQRAQADIRESTLGIWHHVNELIAARENGNLTPTLRQEFQSLIQEKNQQFLHGVEYLLDVTQYYVYEPSSFWKKWMRRAEDSETETIRKWMNDLNYIRQYITQQSEVGLLAGDLSAKNLQTHHLRRLNKYLQTASSLGDLLGNFVREALKQKQAGGTKFATPKAYQSPSK